MVLFFALNDFCRFFRSKPQCKYSGRIDPEGARPDELRSDGQCHYLRDWLPQWFENGMGIFRMSQLGGFWFFRQDGFTGML